jgi:hypothetical protein
MSLPPPNHRSAWRRAGRRLWVCLCAVVVLGLALPALANPTGGGKADDERFTETVTDALWWGDFPALLDLYRSSMAPQARDATGLRSRFPLFHAGIRRVLDDRRATAPLLAQVARRMVEQQALQPDEPLWLALEAEMLLAQAWAVRGGGYANTVPPHVWDEFEGLLRRSIDGLARHGDRALATPLAHRVLLAAGRGLSLPQARLQAVLDDGLRRHPQAASSLVLTGLEDHLPKWRGDARQVDLYILRHAPQLAPMTADEGYAWLYSQAARSQFEHQLFQDSRADWPRMRRGYEAMLQRQESPGTRQRAAYLACIARDREAFLAFAGPGLEPLQPDEWGSNPQVTAASCSRWGASQ